MCNALSANQVQFTHFLHQIQDEKNELCGLAANNVASVDHAANIKTYEASIRTKRTVANATNSVRESAARCAKKQKRRTSSDREDEDRAQKNQKRTWSASLVKISDTRVAMSENIGATDADSKATNDSDRISCPTTEFVDRKYFVLNVREEKAPFQRD